MRHAAVAAALLLMSLASWKIFPGHTWLQQDTQIYVPILEHLDHTGVLDNDILVQRPHVAFTVYDELTLGLHRVSGAELEAVLACLQIVLRTLGLWGVYLIATSLGLELAPALFVTLLWSFGATVSGPAVLTVEYEAVPRGFAVPLLMLGIGLAAHERWRESGIATALAVVIHPPTVWPILCVYLWKARKREGREALVQVFIGLALLLVAAKFQQGVSEHQSFLSTLTPELEKLQRMRASYNWVDTWWLTYLPQYIFLTIVLWLALRRLGDHVSEGLRDFVRILPVLALLSVSASYLALNILKLALIPQLQPARALLFIPALASVLTAAAGCVSLRSQKYIEAFCWFLIPWLLPIQTGFNAAPSLWQVLVWFGFAGASVFFAHRLWTLPTLGLAYFALAATVTLYPQMHTPELHEVSLWAARATPREAVFLFPDNGKANAPGIFRTEALRAVYADWKGGGQVNYLPAFATEWWQRWQQLKQPDGPHYAALGVDYIVMNAGHELPLAEKVHANSRYWVYKTK